MVTRKKGAVVVSHNTHQCDVVREVLTYVWSAAFTEDRQREPVADPRLLY
jgi:hypothetical protein